MARDIDSLGYVGEETNKRLLYLVAISRKLEDPLSAIVLSQSGAGKSGLTEVIERLTPPEDVVLLTRLTPQSLYYTEPGFLDRKLVIVEERYGSMEADYSIRVLQSRKKLIAAAPVKDPQTGNMRTKVFTVEARAAFIEATTASRCQPRERDALLRAADGRDRGADEEDPRATAPHADRGGARAAPGGRRRSPPALERPAPPRASPGRHPLRRLLSFPSAWMRTRRDHARFLNLIEVLAFLHQHQRERTQGRRHRGRLLRTTRPPTRFRRRGPGRHPLGPQEASASRPSSASALCARATARASLAGRSARRSHDARLDRAALAR